MQLIFTIHNIEFHTQREITRVVNTVLAVDDRHVAFCEYSGSVAMQSVTKFETISGMGPG
jgi:hypothetical protein